MGFCGLPEGFKGKPRIIDTEFKRKRALGFNGTQPTTGVRYPSESVNFIGCLSVNFSVT